MTILHQCTRCRVVYVSSKPTGLCGLCKAIERRLAAVLAKGTIK